MASRTRVLVLFAVVALVAASCSSNKSSESKTASTPAPAANSAVNVGAPNGAWIPTKGLPFKDPPVQLYSKKKVLHVDLDAETQTIDVSGQPLGARPWNGFIIGPTLNVNPGDTLDVTFKNGTDQDTNIHYHGMHVSPLDEGDNVFRTFRPGGTYHSAIQIPKDHEVGTYWYHVHFHGVSEGQVMGGLSGLLIVQGLEQRLSGNLRKITQRQMAIRDVRVAKDSDSIVMNPDDNDGSDTLTRLVNGLAEPTFSIAQGETQLWRLANVGADAFLDVNMPSHNFVVIAEDGVPVWRVHTESHLVMPPGQRYDVLVTGGTPGTYQLQTAEIPSCGAGVTSPICSAPKPRTQGTLATVTVTPSNKKPVDMPTTMMNDKERAEKDLANVQPNKPPRQFTFSFGACPPPDQAKTCSLINGMAFDPNRMPDVAPTLGDVEDWTLINATPGPHPFHIHVNSFQVIAVSDSNGNLQPVDSPGLQDVVNIPSQQTINGNAVPGKVVIRNRYLDFPGWFVFHCHILNHEDNGMMLTVEVLKPGQQPSPPPHDSSLSAMHMLDMPANE